MEPSGVGYIGAARLINIASGVLGVLPGFFCRPFPGAFVEPSGCGALGKTFFIFLWLDFVEDVRAGVADHAVALSERNAGASPVES